MKDDAKTNRMLGSRLAQLLYGTTPKEKLVIVEAIEETGNVLFGLTAKIAARIQADGRSRAALSRPVPFQPRDRSRDARRRPSCARSDPLTEFERVRCLDLAFRVFEMFSDWTSELLAYRQELAAHSGPCRTSLRECAMASA